MINFEIIQQCLEIILSCQTSVSKITVDMPPILQSTIIKQAQVLTDDKRDDVVLQALPKYQHSPYAAIAVLKRMNAFELHVKINNIVKPHFLYRIII